MTFLRIPSWEKHQFYKDGRTPIWIKLHRSILTDRPFMLLSPAHQSLLMLMWVIAAEGNGYVDDSPEEIGWRLHRSVTVGDIDTLCNGGFLERVDTCPYRAIPIRGVNETARTGAVAGQVVYGWADPKHDVGMSEAQFNVRVSEVDRWYDQTKDMYVGGDGSRRRADFERRFGMPLTRWEEIQRYFEELNRRKATA